MTDKQVASITVEELKDLIATVVDARLSAMKTSLLQEIADLIENNAKREAPTTTGQSGSHVRTKLTEAEKQQRLKDLDEMFRRWDEEYDEEEQRETFEYLQKALDEDRLSNRPLFPQK
ncbi:hypothetical protein [Iningainema tapete]|uniref:Uncharacterized protein n=1 Tax=Iningainema tapete BLCC-T55 TaxID=2748662 RepID=A0A8J6XFC4_9CYAN|nr:hypothetical protein [Iningainema tapete]MBD2774639.1 hypothetical protein [Iningainema tapete BLCC-T55]